MLTAVPRNTDSLARWKTSVWETDKCGQLKVNSMYQTHAYAVGDVIGYPSLRFRGLMTKGALRRRRW